MASRGGFLVSDDALRRRNTAKKQHASGLKPQKTITRKKRKPEWDSTVNDLNVHKATEEELRKRHEAHKSKNLGVPLRKPSGKENESLLLNTPETVMLRKQAILQEILYGEDKLQDVLAETDRTMSAVKDLFGDDPKKFLGFPNVTVAPNKPDENASRLVTGPFADIPETPTHLSTLSDSIMRTPAINEVSDESEMSDSSPEATQTTKFEPKLDLQRYRQFISHEAANEKQLDMIPQRLQGNIAAKRSNGMVCESSIAEGDSMAVNGHVQMNDKTLSTIQSDSTLNVPDQSQAVPTSTNQIPTNDRQFERPPEYQAVNIPKKHKAKSKPKSVDTSTSSNNGLKSLDDLKKMVESLEDEIAEYEMETGRQPTATTLQSNSFSGYTSSLITAVTKLMKYLKETETQRKAEAVLREQIMQGFSEQRTLIDALTNDILLTQEQNVALQSDFQTYRHQTDRQLGYLQSELQTVLKSFEYYTVQTTINTLNSTKPVPLPQTHNNNQHMDHRARGEYIPVTTIHDVPPDSTGMDYGAAVSGQQCNDVRWNDQGVSSSNPAQPAFANPVVSMNESSHSSNTHIHINQPYLHHEADNFTIRQPLQKHLTIPGHSELRSQQTSAPISTTVTASSTGNFGLDSHGSNDRPAQYNDSVSTGRNHQGSRSNIGAEFGMNAHTSHNQPQQNSFVSNGQHIKGNTSDVYATQDDNQQHYLIGNRLVSDQRLTGNSDVRENPLHGVPTERLLHNGRIENFTIGQTNQPLHSSRERLLVEGGVEIQSKNAREQHIERGPFVNHEIPNAMHNAGHAIHNSATQPYFSAGQRSSEMRHPEGVSSLPHTHDSSKYEGLQHPYVQVSTTNTNDLFPKGSSSFNSVANTQMGNLPQYNSQANFMPMSTQSSVITNGAPNPSHDPLQTGKHQIPSRMVNRSLDDQFNGGLQYRNDDRSAPITSHDPLQNGNDPIPLVNRSDEGQFNGGLQYVNEESKEDSLLMKSLSKDPLGTMRLRNRLEGIAMKQKNSAALKAALQTRTEKHSKVHPSPHVHFKSPLEEPNTKGAMHGFVSALPEKSPSVSPIPDDVPSIEMVAPRKGRQVVVNLPSIWSDVSSTVSI